MSAVLFISMLEKKNMYIFVVPLCKLLIVQWILTVPGPLSSKLCLDNYALTSVVAWRLTDNVVKLDRIIIIKNTRTMFLN